MSTTEMTRKDLGRLANNGIAVQSLQNSLSRAESVGTTMPLLINRLARERGWQEFLFPEAPDRVYRWNAAEFRRFIESPRPGGCETPLYVLERMLRGTEAWDTFLELTRGERGAPEGNRNAAKEEETNCDSITVCHDADPAPTKPPPTGTSVSYALRRLSRERPDLYEAVKSGETTANAAMIEAGFRPPQLTIPLDPRKAARRIARHLTREQFSELVDEALSIYTGKRPD